MRFTLLPDERFAALHARLIERIDAAAGTLDAATFASAFDPLMRDLVAATFTAAGAHEGTIWLADASEHDLIPVYNSGARAADFVGTYRQPLSRGLISLVFKNGQSLAENAMALNVDHDKSLDEKLGVEASAMLAVPLYFGKRLRGVVSCVQLRHPHSREAASPGFSLEALHRIERLSAVLTRLIDYTLVGTTVGWLSSSSG
jgi:transcriptional regulator with GAF, ATPase, and Fis domain